MSKKQLNVEGIMNELEGASLFFAKPTPIKTPPPTISAAPLAETQVKPAGETARVEIPSSITTASLTTKGKREDNHSIKPKSIHASKQASMNPSKIYDPVEVIRKTVKQVGKEVFFVRITPEEKRTLASIVYSFNEIYRDEGRKTSENEVGRIALNYLLEDYRASGNRSILARVLAALNA